MYQRRCPWVYTLMFHNLAEHMDLSQLKRGRGRKSGTHEQLPEPTGSGPLKGPLWPWTEMIGEKESDCQSAYGPFFLAAPPHASTRLRRPRAYRGRASERTSKENGYSPVSRLSHAGLSAAAGPNSPAFLLPYSHCGD